MTPGFDRDPRARRTPAGHWIPAGARLPGLQVEDARQVLLVGRGASLGPIRHAGTVTLTRSVAVHGDVTIGRDLVVGAGCRIAGAIDAGGRVVLQFARVAGPIRAAGDVLLLGECRVADVQAGGDILIAGTPRTGHLEPGGRVATRAF